MTVSIASRPISSAGALSEQGQRVLAFIDGGREWFEWARNDTSANHAFPDESAFVAAVQEGLHESKLALLPRLGLLVSPIKLLTLTSDDLRVLAEGEGGDAAGEPDRLGAILSDQRLVRQAELDAGRALLDTLGVSGAPIFQVLDLNDRLAIRGLVDPADGEGSPDPALRQEAARFAAEQGRTPLEFVDYYRTYLALAAKPGASADASGRQTRAETALATLLPMLFGALRCLQVAGLVAPHAVAMAVQRWLMTGKPLGFARLSLAVQQIVANTGFMDESGDAARTVVDRHMAAAQTFLTSAAQGPLRGLLGQDGASCVFPLGAGNQQAELHLAPTGMITQSGYRTVQS